MTESLTASAFRLYPEDSLVSSPVLRTIRSINIQAAPEKIWPWLAQMGQGRGGFYSYDWLENLFGMNIHNTDRILPELQELNPGDLIPFWRGVGVHVIDLQPPQYLVLASTLYGEGNPGGGGSYGGSWIFELHPAGPAETMLVVRSAVAWFEPRWLCRLFTWLLLIPSLKIMEWGMLKGIQRRAEKSEQEDKNDRVT